MQTTQRIKLKKLFSALSHIKEKSYLTHNDYIMSHEIQESCAGLASISHRR